MSGRLVLVRHGQSHANVDRRLDTRLPGAELTPLGRDQARTFARTATSRPAVLLHSVATRAAQTAAEISAEVNVSVSEVTGIHEVQVGDLENRNDDDAIAEFDALYRRWLEGERDVPMPGGESANQVLDRYLPVLTDIRINYLDDDNWTSDVVVVSHVSPIKAAVTWALRGGPELSWRLSLGVASITRISTGGPVGPALVSFNETAHLDGLG